MKEIKLNLGTITLVDDEDFEYLNQFKWFLNSKGYAQRTIKVDGRITTVKMHRVIMNAPTNVQVDHKNGNKLDNQKHNLRVCNNSQNQMNKGKQKNNTSGYVGVTWMKDRQKWRAQIFLNEKNHILGSFDNPVDAALAYNNAALEMFGEFAHLNDI